MLKADAIPYSLQLLQVRHAGFLSMVKDLLSGLGVIKSFQAQEEAAALYYDRNGKLEQEPYGCLSVGQKPRQLLDWADDIVHHLDEGSAVL